MSTMSSHAGGRGLGLAVFVVVVVQPNCEARPQIHRKCEYLKGDIQLVLHSRHENLGAEPSKILLGTSGRYSYSRVGAGETKDGKCGRRGAATGVLFRKR